MKHNFCKKKEYVKLRLEYSGMELEEFEEIADKYHRLKIQFYAYKFADKLASFNIPKIEIIFLRFLSMLIDFIRWKIYDIIILLIEGKKFSLYGVSCYCGRQGSGKTIGVVREVERLKTRFPEAIVCTNIDYTMQDYKLTSWLQLLELRNGDKGVIFVIDEVQNQGLDWQKFPDSLLRVITQQRKQKIKIFLTAQVYKTVPIQLRRQCFDVIECRTFAGRWTRYKIYDAEEYNNVIDNPTPEKKLRMPRKGKESFIQNNYIRKLYDTRQVIYGLDDYNLLCSDERAHIKEVTEDKKLIRAYTRINGVINERS